MSRKWKLTLIAIACGSMAIAATIVGYEDWQLRGSAPGNPASGYLRIWADNTAGFFKCLTSAGASCYWAASPASASAVQGNGTLFQLSTGTATSGHCVKYDANGNTVDAGAACGTGAGITLQTNGVNNGSQSTLNLAAGTNMTVTDGGSGTITFAASGGGGGSAFFSGSLTSISAGSWSNLGTGCTRSSVTGAAGGTALKVIGATGAQNVCGYSVAVAAGDFSHTFVLYASLAYPGASNPTAEVGFTDGAKVEYCGWGNPGNTTQMTIGAAKGTALTGGSLSAVNGGTTAASNEVSSTGPVWFQLVRTGTNLTCNYSPDGVNFIAIFTDTVPFLTASALYFGHDPRASTVASIVYLESYN